MVPTASDEQVVSEDDGKQMGLRSTSRKPKLQNVAIEEWTLANMRTMDALIAEGVIFAAGIRDYVSYTIKICELFCCYDRASVLQYDQEYRHLQSIYGYRWGTDTPHLHTVHLRVKRIIHLTLTTDNKGRGVRSTASADVKEACKLYNRQSGCHYGDSCKFTHICSEPGCNEGHLASSITVMLAYKASWSWKLTISVTVSSVHSLRGRTSWTGTETAHFYWPVWSRGFI